MDCLRAVSQRDGACAVNFFSNQPALNYGYYKPEKPWQQPVDAPGPRVTLEGVSKRRLEAGIEPNGITSKIPDIVQLFQNTLEITNPIGIGIAKSLRIDLIKHRIVQPLRHSNCAALAIFLASASTAFRP